MTINSSLRYSLIQTLMSLSDLEYQISCWLNKICHPPIKADSFDFAVHFLFDDTNLGDDVESCIGYILRGKEEAIELATLCKSIDYLLDEYGCNLSDAEYMSTPEWHKVITAAQKALAVCSLTPLALASDEAE